MAERVDYRNAAYQGQLSLGRRHGPGLLILDSGRLLLGYWAEDELDGPFVELQGVRTYCYGLKRRGRLSGLCVSVKETQVVAGQYYQGRLEGPALKGDFKRGRGVIVRGSEGRTTTVSEFELGHSCSVRELILLSGLEQFLPELPSHCLLLAEFCQRVVADLAQLCNSIGLKKYSREHTYFGFLDSQGQASGLGFILDTAHGQAVASLGEFQAGQQHGPALVYVTDSISFSGSFQASQLQGEGIRYDAQAGSFIHARYNQNTILEIISQGKGQPLKETLVLRKK
jgi:hypothetical protein